MADGNRMEGKVALVTGGASGIGAETSRVFIAEGGQVMIADVNDNLGRQTADDIGDRAAYLHLDTTQEFEWVAVVKETIERFGRLDVLVNAAGISGRLGPTTATPKVEEAELENWNAVMNVNSTGIFLGTKHAIPEMRKAGGGAIINISSIYGLVGSPHNAAYHASKGSVRLFTKSAAMQYASEGIRVNSVHPGFVTSPMTEIVHNDAELSKPRLDQTPLGRFGTPNDIAKGCLYLASDDAAWVTGSELVIDGGMTAR